MYRSMLFTSLCVVCFIAIVCYHVHAIDTDAFDTIILRVTQQAPDVPITQRNIAALRTAGKVEYLELFLK
jgi:hypothetical protein